MARFDLHVHSAPCVAPRRADDVATVRAYAAAGFAGCVLKGHCEPTVGRAAAAAAALPDPEALAVYGGLVLNDPAGGLNPAAVAAALALGARVVWLPTVDAAAHREAGLAHPPPCAPAAVAGPGWACPPRDPEAAAVVGQIVRLVAEADAVLATGHVSGDEAAWVVAAARRAGGRPVLLTHPTFAVPGLRPAQVRELCDLGAVCEITAYQLLHQPDCDAARLAALVWEVGPARCVLSSDAGQPTSPPAPEALDRLVEALVSAGVDRGACEAMASAQPAALVSPR